MNLACFKKSWITISIKGTENKITELCLLKWIASIDIEKTINGHNNAQKILFKFGATLFIKK